MSLAGEGGVSCCCFCHKQNQKRWLPANSRKRWYSSSSGFIEASLWPVWPNCPHMCPVMDLVYWRDVRKTGVVFTGLVISLASVFQLSVITVFSHICLATMCITFPLRLYYKLLELLRWNPGLHPYQWVCQWQLVVDFAKLKNKLNDAALRETTKTLLQCQNIQK